VKNLADLLDSSGGEKALGRRMGFFRSLAPQAALLVASDGFACGLCGAGAASREAAQRCLERCLKHRQDRGVVAATPLAETYTCPVCSRHYARRDDALDCHGRQRRLANLVSLQDQTDQDPPPLARKRLFDHVLKLEALVPLAMRTPRQLSKRSFPGAPEPAQTAAPRPSVRTNSAVARVLEAKPPEVRVPEAVAPEAPPERPQPPVLVAKAPEDPKATKAAAAPEPPPVMDDDGEGPYRTPGMKPFTRHDARYKCSVCAQMFFTRSEVEQCFQSHPERS
jgi:hypothetical protein